jgi:hypothetical protein
VVKRFPSLGKQRQAIGWPVGKCDRNVDGSKRHKIGEKDFPR